MGKDPLLWGVVLQQRCTGASFGNSGSSLSRDQRGSCKPGADPRILVSETVDFKEVPFRVVVIEQPLSIKSSLLRVSGGPLDYSKLNRLDQVVW